MAMVPRLMNRLYNEVVNQVKDSLIKRTLFNRALAAKDVDMKR